MNLNGHSCFQMRDDTNITLNKPVFLAMDRLRCEMICIQSWVHVRLECRAYTFSSNNTYVFSFIHIVHFTIIITIILTEDGPKDRRFHCAYFILQTLNIDATNM